MRKALRAHLVAQSLDARVIDEVVLAAEEALNNAIIPAGDVDGMIRVSSWVSGGEAAIEVQDGGCGVAFRGSDPRFGPDARRPRGRGLFLIHSMMHDVTVKPGRGGTTVRMVRHIA